MDDAQVAIEQTILVTAQQHCDQYTVEEYTSKLKTNTNFSIFPEKKLVLIILCLISRKSVWIGCSHLSLFLQTYNGLCKSRLARRPFPSITRIKSLVATIQSRGHIVAAVQSPRRLVLATSYSFSRTGTSSLFIDESLKVPSRLIDDRTWMPLSYFVCICRYNCAISYAIYNIYAEFVFIHNILCGIICLCGVVIKQSKIQYIHVFEIDRGRMAWLIQAYKHMDIYMQSLYSARICTQYIIYLI